MGQYSYISLQFIRDFLIANDQIPSFSLVPGQTSSQNSIIIISGDYMSIGSDVMIQEIKCSNLILRRTAQFCEKNTYC